MSWKPAEKRYPSLTFLATVSYSSDATCWTIRERFEAIGQTLAA